MHITSARTRFEHACTSSCKASWNGANGVALTMLPILLVLVLVLVVVVLLSLLTQDVASPQSRHLPGLALP
jgi:hypothetical protein